MILRETVSEIVEAYIANTGYYLVDTKVGTNNHITVEIDHFDGVSLDFCIKLTRVIEQKLDRDVEDYELEVSSAGLTSPFKVLKQYEKNIGNEVEVMTKDGKKLVGILQGFDVEKIILQQEKQIKSESVKRKITVTEDTEILFENIKTTKYIIRFK